ncbi:MAG: hypothetical protein FD123_3025 [Bacteroidetes bacterium]|nr:MAG: hypothetical protein FD123_3025 [Bacteroidota bacterium]
MSTAATFFTEEEKKRIADAIGDAERMTSGEIRVHLENFCAGDPYKRALSIFEKIGLHQTKQRNGVLFYIAVRSHKLAILGDEGIHAVVPAGFWDNIIAQLQTAFGEGKAADGLCEALRQAGDQLKAHFPFQEGDVNEQPDHISHE